MFSSSESKGYDSLSDNTSVYLTSFTFTYSLGSSFGITELVMTFFCLIFAFVIDVCPIALVVLMLILLFYFLAPYLSLLLFLTYLSYDFAFEYFFKLTSDAFCLFFIIYDF